MLLGLKGGHELEPWIHDVDILVKDGHGAREDPYEHCGLRTEQKLSYGSVIREKGGHGRQSPTMLFEDPFRALVVAGRSNPTRRSRLKGCLLVWTA